MIRRPPRSTLFPTRRSSDLLRRRACSAVCVPPRFGSGLAVPPALSASADEDRKSTRLNSSHGYISYAVFCLKKKKKRKRPDYLVATAGQVTSSPPKVSTAAG